MNATQVKSLINRGVVGRHSAGNGLYLRVTKSGVGYWVVRYTIFGKRREISIGKFPSLSLADASAETAMIKAGIRNDVDPITQRKKQNSQTLRVVDELAEDWLQECDKRLKNPHIPRQVYRDYISPVIGAFSIDQVTPSDIRVAIHRVVEKGAPTRANDTLMYCKQLFRHGVKLDIVSNNPALAFTVDDAGGVEKSRERALTVEEIETVFACFQNNADQFTRENYLAFALLLLLGVRKGELLSAEWSEFDSEKRLWNLPEERSKTGNSITIPLPAIVMEWLKELYIRAGDSIYVFPNRRASKNGHISHDTLNSALNKLFTQGKLSIPHFTVHDLRRTCRSLLASQGVPGHVAERCLNHKLKGVEGIYDRYDYLEERSEALNKIAELLSPILDSNCGVTFSW